MNLVKTISLATVLLTATACGKKQTQDVTDRSNVEVSTSCAPGLSISPQTAVITINSVDVPCSELAVRTQNAVLHAQLEFDEKVRELQQQSLIALVDERLLASEMKDSKQAIAEFIDANVRAEPATEEEIQSVYAQALAAGEQLPAIELVRSELEAFINEKKQRSALDEYRGQLREKAAIKVDMPILLPPIFDVEVVGNSKGTESAPVTIVEFSDFECGFCARVEPTVEKILNTYGDKVRFVYRDLPLPNHLKAPKAAEATHCANNQEKYWEMHEMLFKNQHALDVPDLKRYAGELGLNQEQFDKCLDDGATSNIVAASMSEATRLGISGTPAFFVNGRLLSGAQPFERFVELIDHELESAAR